MIGILWLAQMALATALLDWQPVSWCPTCKATQQRSSVFYGACMTTLLATVTYYDESGKLHSPDDPNVTTQVMNCSKGHSWSFRMNARGERL